MLSTENKKRFLINIAFFAVVILLIYIVFKSLLAYLMPFVIAVLVAALLQRPARFLHKKIKVPKSICSVVLVLLTYILAVGVIGTAVYFLYQQLYGFFTDMSEYIPHINEFVDRIKNMAISISNALPDEIIEHLNTLPSTAVDSITSKATAVLSNFAAGLVTSTPQLLVSCIVTVVASCYIAADYDFLYEYFTSNAPQKLSTFFKDVKSSVSETMVKVLRGYLLLMLLTFAELTLSMYILGIKYAVVVAAIVSIIDILPILGTGTVLIPWSIISFINGNYLLGIGLIVTYVVVTIVRNFLEPKVIGHQVGLYPLLTLVAMFTGLRLFGFFGMLLLPVVLILLINLYRKGSYKL